MIDSRTWAIVGWVVLILAAVVWLLGVAFKEMML